MLVLGVLQKVHVHYKGGLIFHNLSVRTFWMTPSYCNSTIDVRGIWKTILMPVIKW